MPPEERNDEDSTISAIREALQGKTLQVYLAMLDSGEPIGAREIQKKLEYSSANLAVHHLDKLCRLGLAAKDEYGRYYVAKRISVGIMDLFMNVGGIRFPRVLFYAALFAALSIMYFTTAPIIIGRDSFYVMVIAIPATALFAYEAIKVWKQIA